MLICINLCVLINQSIIFLSQLFLIRAKNWGFKVSYSFSKSSMMNFLELDPRLQRVLNRAIKIIDFKVIEGHRDQRTQDKYFWAHTSKLKWPKSKHNQNPSLAVDIIPYPSGWKNNEAFYKLAGVVLACAHEEDVLLRWGGDWDRDGDSTDQSFMDLAHFEIFEFKGMK